MIVRWGLEALPEVLREVGVTRAYFVASPRWSALDLPFESDGTWTEIPSHRIDEAASQAAAFDGIVAVGGGSAIDTAKAVSAATGLPLISIPTTYAGAEWTTYFGVRDPDRHMRGGGSGAYPAGIVYEPALTLDLGHAQTGGTAMNALAHCAEALYVQGHNADADADALAGARLIATWLPRVLEQPKDRDARHKLLEGAMHAGAALGGSMLALGHAMAQAVGGRYGLPHGTLNGICLPAALRFNAGIVPGDVRRFGEAIGAPEDPAAEIERLAGLAGPTRLRELGVPEPDLPELAEAAAERAGNQANPRPASREEIEQLLRSVW
jgi:alcohol dehydrogenase class IV